MKTDIKEKWVAALRSGEYSQTKEVLYDGEGYCCLGVLCDIAVKEGILNAPVPDDHEAGAYKFTAVDDEGDESVTVLPEAVKHWAGFRTAEPKAHGVGLIDYNDNKNKDFDFIADKVEKYL